MSTPVQNRSIIVGTTQVCSLVIRQLALVESPPELIGVALLDENDQTTIEGLPVLGSADDLIALCAAHEIASAIVTLPASHRSMWREISISLHRAGVVERFVPPMDELLSCAPQVTVSQATASPTVAVGAPRIDLAKLVGRHAHTIDRDLVAETLTGNTVLVTGAGGSIGSELVRQIATFSPSTIVLMERSENALFEVDRQLKESFPKLNRVAVLHDVVDAPRTLSLLQRYAPQVVIHAAAHKHVPLMEDHPSHAVTNNLFGTKSIADASIATGVERFVLISSDKAVNPVNVMGATKRLAEMYVQSLARKQQTIVSGTKLSMVRFGNVLGSACSVLPIWADQIAAGRPVTVTDERMTRYFMTIPEAATLVLQAGAMSGTGSGSGSGSVSGDSGEVFVLDMGEPINIFALARRFIKACGYDAVIGQPIGPPNSLGISPKSVPVILTGARPGEKLHEQLSYDAEGLERTAHPGIYALDDPTDVEPATIDAMIASMDSARASHARKAVLEQIARYIPTMNGALLKVSAA